MNYYQKNKTQTLPSWQKKTNTHENFDAQYKSTLNIEERAERTRLVRDEMMEKYHNYEQTKTFISFIASTEGIFSQAKTRKWDAAQTEDAMIKSEIYLMSLQSGIDEEIFRAIYDDFKDASATVERIQIIAKELIEKYIECGAACEDFIKYLRDFILIFSHARDDHSYTLDEQKADLIQARMKVIAETGNPELSVLEGIYADFAQRMHKD